MRAHRGLVADAREMEVARGIEHGGFELQALLAGAQDREQVRLS